jgi:GNAT superfamily N-acetyltransferase
MDSANITGPFGTAQVTRANVSDVPGVLAVFDEAVAWLTQKGLSGQWGTTPFSAIPNMHNQFIDWIHDGTLYVARLNGTVEATIVLTDQAPKYAAHLWHSFPSTALYIEAFAATRSPQGRGVGLALLKWAEKYGKESGKTMMWLDCWADNPDLCKYYEQAGYEARGLLVVNEWRARLFAKQLSNDMKLESAPGLQGSPAGK